MVLYSLGDVTDDMVLGKSIFLPNGELLLAAGFRLTERYRARLKQLGFTTVYVQVEGTDDVIPETIINEHVQREITASVNKTADGVESVLMTKRKSVESMRRLIRDRREHLNRYIAGAGLTNTIETIIQDLLAQPSVVLNLSSLQSKGDSLLSHAIAVTVTALCIGRRYRFSYDEMKQLAMGAVNFDLGLVALPPETIAGNTEELSPEAAEQYRQHTVYGYLMLSQNPSITPTSAAVALQHHEHQDGTGFPRGIKGENRPPRKDFSRKGVIHRFSEVVAVADTYDMLTTGRMGPRLSTAEAIRKVIEMAGDTLNSDIVKTLVSIIPLYPVGTRIRVADAPVSQLSGYYGVVAKVDPANLAEPQIILYESRNHKRVKPILVDLSKHKGFVLELLT
jgi:HD-GYP domain-containing protein (c-di-GMP phosphodiesterase class II)